MTPTRFAWPYGGRQVFLTGSFTRWTDHVLMRPVEGSSMVFQTVLNLAAGCHQYKFLVDGVWRFDEQNPYVTDEHGSINNIIFVRDPEPLPVLTSDTSSSKQIMDVDNRIINYMAFLGSMPREPVPQISDGEVDVCRHRLSVLMSRYTVYELLPESGKVSILDVKVPVKQAFHVMFEQGLPVVPVWDDFRGQLIGMLTASDFILILRELHNKRSVVTNEELEMHSISAWKEEKYQLNRESDRSLHRPFGRSLVQAGPHESLKDVALRILEHKISSIPIIHFVQDGSCPQLLYNACLAGILKYICRHFKLSPGSLPLFKQPIGRLPFGTWIPDIGKASGRQPVLVRHSTSLSSALNLLIQERVSSIPIVDDNGSLLEVYSRSDITSLANGNVYTYIHLDQTNMHQALQLVYEANGTIYAHRRFQTCLRSDSLYDVMERLSDPAVRRVIVVEAGSKRVEGIVSLSDVFNFLLR
ncbi:hypothetical protein Syun_024653 [Stephania yunnanensis]|uniref:CBS domain-containing protein n=1 Tax=Stephania yunnanensis TaxID=152371 RepID=A0AAP0I4R8_9MAGN